MDKIEQIKIYTDGSTIKNPGNGGYAAIILYDNTKHIIQNGLVNTTNNRMELLAAISSMEYIIKLGDKISKDTKIDFYIDSQYVINSMYKWMQKWKADNFRTSTGKPVKNIDLVTKLSKFHDDLAKLATVNYNWVKGHSGDIYNEECDILAKAASKMAHTKDEGYKE